VIGHFFVPFVILLWRPVKKNPAWLCAVCGWILLMHLVDMYWVIIPERAPSLSAAGGNPVLWTAGNNLPADAPDPATPVTLKTDAGKVERPGE
jgi:hypothetical protein